MMKITRVADDLEAWSDAERLLAKAAFFSIDEATHMNYVVNCSTLARLLREALREVKHDQEREAAEPEVECSQAASEIGVYDPASTGQAGSMNSEMVIRVCLSLAAFLEGDYETRTSRHAIAH